MNEFLNPISQVPLEEGVSIFVITLDCNAQLASGFFDRFASIVDSAVTDEGDAVQGTRTMILTGNTIETFVQLLSDAGFQVVESALAPDSQN